MKFSIRLLFAVTLLVALLIQVLQARLDRRDVRFLELQLAQERSRYKKLDARASWLRKRNELCETVLKDFESPSEVHIAAEKRFKLLPLQEADQ